MVSLAIGAHAALNKRALDAAKAHRDRAGQRRRQPGHPRLALVIGNGHYPDANAPLTQPINDARALTAALRHDGFDVDVVEDASKDDMTRAVARLKSKIQPGLRGDAVLRRLRHPGRPRELHDPGRCRDLEGSRRAPRRLSIESVLDVMKEQGARAKLVVHRRLAPQPL